MLFFRAQLPETSPGEVCPLIRVLMVDQMFGCALVQ